MLMQTAMMAMLANAPLPSGDINRHLSGELLDSLLVQEGREREREILRKVPSLRTSAEAPSSWEETTTSETWMNGLRESQTRSHADRMENLRKLWQCVCLSDWC